MANRIGDGRRKNTAPPHTCNVLHVTFVEGDSLRERRTLHVENISIFITRGEGKMLNDIKFSEYM